MSAPSPCNVTQTTQREFAGAKVQQKLHICKFFRDFFAMQNAFCDDWTPLSHADSGWAGMQILVVEVNSL